MAQDTHRKYQEEIIHSKGEAGDPSGDGGVLCDLRMLCSVVASSPGGGP